MYGLACLTEGLCTVLGTHAPHVQGRDSVPNIENHDGNRRRITIQPESQEYAQLRTLLARITHEATGQAEECFGHGALGTTR